MTIWRLLAVVLLSLAAVTASSCGKADPNRAKLERLLAKQRMSISDGETRNYKAHSASCIGARQIAGRQYYLCRIDYRPVDGTPPPSRHQAVCAAVDSSVRQGYILRLLDDCLGSR